MSLLQEFQRITNCKNPKDSKGWTPLHFAAQNGHLEVFKYLMEMVKEKEPITKEIANSYVGKSTPFHLAFRLCNWKICEYILENVDGILNPNKSPSWKAFYNPLYAAAHWGNLELCEKIIKKLGT